MQAEAEIDARPVEGRGNADEHAGEHRESERGKTKWRPIELHRRQAREITRHDDRPGADD